MAKGVKQYNFKYDAEVVFLVGNIASGKSTYIKQMNGTHVVLSRDKIRYMMGGGDYVFIKALEPAVWRAEITLFRELLSEGINIVIDEVNTNLLMRARYLEALIYSPYDYTSKAVVFPKIPKEEAVRRRMSDPHGDFTKEDWEWVYDNFEKRRTDPTYEEGFTDIIDVIPILNQGGKLTYTEKRRAENW